jgi:hypothetical protein
MWKRYRKQGRELNISWSKCGNKVEFQGRPPVWQLHEQECLRDEWVQLTLSSMARSKLTCCTMLPLLYPLTYRAHNAWRKRSSSNTLNAACVKSPTQQGPGRKAQCAADIEHACAQASRVAGTHGRAKPSGTVPEVALLLCKAQHTGAPAGTNQLTHDTRHVGAGAIQPPQPNIRAGTLRG